MFIEIFQLTSQDYYIYLNIVDNIVEFFYRIIYTYKYYHNNILCNRNSEIVSLVF